MYAHYRSSTVSTLDAVFVLPSPNESVSDLSLEFTLLEGSELTSFVSDSEISLSEQSAPTPSFVPTVLTIYPRRIRLLAFFASLLAVDETTLHLLEQPPSHLQSPLFPGPPLTHPGVEPDAQDSQHGLFRLLSHRPRIFKDIPDSNLNFAFAVVSPFHIVQSCTKTLLRP
jgi:hypothetical protein